MHRYLNALEGYQIVVMWLDGAKLDSNTNFVLIGIVMGLI